MAKRKHQLPPGYRQVGNNSVLPDRGSVETAIKTAYLCPECGWVEKPPKAAPFRSGNQRSQAFGTSYGCGNCGKEIGTRITGGSYSPKQ
ncbi:MAG: hypothetical protein HZC02_01965 [Candidatus Levybacteria bacterium]|nr:hypothetical protein [Candidatus Levybacteria bacterium]